MFLAWGCTLQFHFRLPSECPSHPHKQKTDHFVMEARKLGTAAFDSAMILIHLFVVTICLCRIFSHSASLSQIPGYAKTFMFSCRHFYQYLLKISWAVSVCAHLCFPVRPICPPRGYIGSTNTTRIFRSWLVPLIPEDPKITTCIFRSDVPPGAPQKPRNQIELIRKHIKHYMT